MRRDRARTLQGTRAGAVSRVVALAIDGGLLFLLGVLVVLCVALVLWVATSRGFTFERPGGIVSLIAAFVYSVAYYAYLWATTGRTVGEHLLGLRTIRVDGGSVRWATALVRSTLTVLFPIGIFWVLLSRRNASVQDLVCRTTVVYDWSNQVVAGGHHVAA
jgi:uncharacterized RDD family membrane protein YckC